MKFTATNQVDCNGMSLACYVDGLSMDDILAKFPEGRMPGYYDEEKGYDNDEVGFQDEVGNQFYVYSRYGHVRVGCHHDLHTQAEQLAKFLRENIGK